MKAARVDAGRFGALLAVLWAAHDVGDHLAQTDHQAMHKATSWCAMAGHVGGYHLLQLASLAALRCLADVRPSWRRTATAVALSAGTHALLDRRRPVLWLLRVTRSAGFAESARLAGVLVDPIPPGVTVQDGHGAIGVARPAPLPVHGPYVADQAAHHLVLALAAAILAGGRR